MSCCPGLASPRNLTVFGGVEYRYGRKEMGHVHGDRLADLPFPRTIHDELIAAGRAELHHVLPDTGWVSRYIASAEDADDVIALFRINYDRYRDLASEAESAAGGGPGLDGDAELGGPPEAL